MKTNTNKQETQFMTNSQIVREMTKTDKVVFNFEKAVKKFQAYQDKTNSEKYNVYFDAIAQIQKDFEEMN